MSEWKTLSINEIATIFDGPHATPKKTNEGPWFLSISSLTSGRLNLDESAHLSDADFEKWTRRVTPREGDVLFSYETRLGEAALMPGGIQACLGRRMGLLRPNLGTVIPKFLLYAYLAPGFQETISSRMIHGATVDRIPIAQMGNWPIQIPGLKEQRVICDVLGALDDKIAVNERIAFTYEALLGCRFTQMGLSAEPSDTDAVSINKFIEFNPKLAKPSAGEPVYVDMAALQTDRARIPTWSRRPPKSGSRFANGDTLLARITPCLENGKTGYVDFMDEGEIGLGSTEFIVMRSRSGVPSHLSYFLARDDRFREHTIRNMVGTSGRQRVSAADAANYFVSRPDPASLSLFGAEASSAFDHMKSLGAESRILASLRDTLLPQLMSGRLRIKDAEKLVEDVT